MFSNRKWPMSKMDMVGVFQDRTVVRGKTGTVFIGMGGKTFKPFHICPYSLAFPKYAPVFACSYSRCTWDQRILYQWGIRVNKILKSFGSGQKMILSPFHFPRPLMDTVKITHEWPRTLVPDFISVEVCEMVPMMLSLPLIWIGIDSCKNIRDH